jgi:hypothetical protein
MTRKPDLQSPESVLAKVRNQARPGLTPHNAQVIFILERFLARVARSPHWERFVLKGGILLYLTGRGPSTRPTIDIDMLAQSLPSSQLDQALAEITQVDVGDRIVFDPSAMTSEEIREEGLYPCRRYAIPFTYGRHYQGLLKLDLSFGDPVFPGPRLVTLPPRFPGQLGGDLLAYPVEAILAEKTQTILVRGLLSTRAKDIFDVWNLARTEPDLHRLPVVESLRVVASYRGTDLAPATIALSEEFAQSPIQNRIWNQFLNRERLTAPTLPEVMVEFRNFMIPIYRALMDGDPIDRVWIPEDGTWS